MPLAAAADEEDDTVLVDVRTYSELPPGTQQMGMHECHVCAQVCELIERWRGVERAF